MYSTSYDCEGDYQECESESSDEEADENAPIKSRNVLARPPPSSLATTEQSNTFEQDMEDELDLSMQSVIQNAFGASSAGMLLNHDGDQATVKQKGSKKKKTSRPGSNAGTSDDGASAGEFYDDIYFDSGSDGEGERHSVADGAGASGSRPAGAIPRSAKRRFPVLSNDDLFYDPDIDEDNELWMANKLRSHRGVRKVKRKKRSQGAADSSQASGSPEEATAAAQGDQPTTAVPRSDAHLSCPACLTTLCVDCQRHDIYRSQYRAMFVMNCAIKADQVLKYKPKEPHKKRPAKKRTDRGGRAADADEAAAEHSQPTVPEAAMEDGSVGDQYKPVVCSQCSTEVAVYDKDEVYHFFNVIAGHA
ncbi:E2F-associated phosphoprotein-like [Sycon ciliatum]|uniref:E2F-associated phosphoprotein-like n=1 Tax=Sycon ciliatum TaxID=27933 RepID=UPI0020AE1413|eukprot:scpid75420/ scgid28376/ E2F-associated phosphoprotein